MENPVEGCEVVENLYERVTRLFQLLAHPGRLSILDELRRGECCVCHLQAVLDRPQPYISQQLRVLRDAGVIESYKDGLFVYYRLANSQVGRLLESALGPAREPECIAECPCPHCQR